MLRKIFKSILFIFVFWLISQTFLLENLKVNTEALSQYNNGDIIQLGTYPQSRVFDESLVAELDSQTKNWISYNYYSGDNDYGSMKSSERENIRMLPDFAKPQASATSR